MLSILESGKKATVLDVLGLSTPRKDNTQKWLQT
jgi:hypothetical protein